MHIEEAVLSVSATGMGVLVGGAALTTIGTAIGLRKVDYERMPQVAMLSSAFFVASLVHVPLGPTSVHLVLNGLVGLVLGWAAFPAILIALFLQMLVFGFGGLTTLGINTAVMAVPAVVAFYLFHGAVRSRHDTLAVAAGFGAGAAAILLSALLLSGAMLAAGDSLRRVAQITLIAHLPIALIEGTVTASAVVFLRRVRPELLRAPLVGVLEVGDA